MDTAVEIEFADGTYRFWLPMPQLLELERICGTKDGEGRQHSKSVFTMFEEMSRGLVYDADEQVQYAGGGASHALDINETLRLGLIGGKSGMVNGVEIEVGALTAKRLVSEYGYPAVNLGDALVAAWTVLDRAINGTRLKKKASPIAGDDADTNLTEKA